MRKLIPYIIVVIVIALVVFLLWPTSSSKKTNNPSSVRPLPGLSCVSFVCLLPPAKKITPTTSTTVPSESFTSSTNSTIPTETASTTSTPLPIVKSFKHPHKKPHPPRPPKTMITIPQVPVTIPPVVCSLVPGSCSLQKFNKHSFPAGASGGRRSPDKTLKQRSIR